MCMMGFMFAGGHGIWKWDRWFRIGWGSVMIFHCFPVRARKVLSRRPKHIAAHAPYGDGATHAADCKLQAASCKLHRQIDISPCSKLPSFRASRLPGFWEVHKICHLSVSSSLAPSLDPRPQILRIASICVYCISEAFAVMPASAPLSWEAVVRDLEQDTFHAMRLPYV